MSNYSGPTSPAKLHRFNECPRRLWFQDVQGLPVEEASGPALATGRAVHDALARGFRLPPERRSDESFEAALRAVWPRYRKPYPFRNADEEREWGREAVAMIRSYAQRTDLEASPVALEKMLETTLTGGNRVRGRLDRIDQLADGTARIVDYKTGRHPLEDDEMRLDPGARIYLLLAEANVGPVAEVRFEYLANNTSVVWQPEREDLPFIADAVIADLDGIWDRRHYEAAPGRHCDWCPFSGICADGWAVITPERRPGEAVHPSAAAPVLQSRH